MASQKDILSTLTKARLLELAAAFEIDGLSGKSKDAVVEALARSRQATAEDLLAEFYREELKDACCALGLDDSGRAKQPIIDRLLGTNGRGISASTKRAESGATPNRKPSSAAKTQAMADDQTTDAAPSATATASDAFGGATASNGSDLRLSEAEKQDIVRYLEADKPLPEKYRFLLFDDKREVELVWNGKTNQVCNTVLPFQTIEQVDEPRREKGQEADEFAGGLFDSRGRQLTGWTNKLIWGDNKLILSSLKNGPLREQIEAHQGGIKLIYIDPPFDVGADFSMDIEVGDGGDTFTKKPNILEEIAYRDTWGKGADSFIAMIYERLILMRDLLAENGSIYVHCDWRLDHHIREVLDDVFGRSGYRNTIAWRRDAPGKGAKG